MKNESRMWRLLVAGILVLCLLPFIGGMVFLLRFIAAAAFVWFAWETWEQDKKKETFIYLCLAVLFQPVWRIPLTQVIWGAVNLVVAVGLILWVILMISSEKKNQDSEKIQK